MGHFLIQEKGCKQGAMAKIQESESYHEKKYPLPTLGGLILNIKKGQNQHIHRVNLNKY